MAGNWDDCYTPDLDFVDDFTFNSQIELNMSQMPPPSPDFVIPETQQEPPPAGKRSHKPSKKKATSGGASGSTAPAPKKKTATPWTKDEKTKLCQSWVNISQDRKVADYQKANIFWHKVRERFYEEVGSRARNPDMISGRWAEIRKYVGLFTNLHNRNSRRMRPSGSDDLQVYQFTCDEWKAEVFRKYGVTKTFDEYYLWRILKGCSKWHELVGPEAQEASKRTKTSSSGAYVTSSSSDGRIGIDLNVSEDAPPEGPSRPLGRDSGKKKATAADLEFSESILKISSSIESATQLKKGKQRLKYLDFLTKDFSHLPIEDQALFEKEKDRIRKELQKD